MTFDEAIPEGNQHFLLNNSYYQQMLFSIPPHEKERAVQYLIDNVPAETLEDVEKLMREKGSDWEIEQHMGFGMYVRNLLLKGGYHWNFIHPDAVWSELIEEAVKKKFGK